MGHRLPTILGKAIDDVIETLNQESDEDRIVDLVHCIERMDSLKNDLQEHAKLRPIIDDGEADVALWNKEIAKYFQGKSPPRSSDLVIFISHHLCRQRLHERTLAVRGSIQVSSSERMLQREQVLAAVRCILQTEVRYVLEIQRCCIRAINALLGAFPAQARLE